MATMENEREPLDSELLTLFSRHSSDLPFNQWADERERWLELVACTLFAYGGNARVHARRAARILWEIGFLDIDSLAAIPLRESVVDPSDSSVLAISQILQRLGFSAPDTSLALTAAVSLAKTIIGRYDGKIQRYLRRYGETMVEHLADDFPEVFAPTNTSSERQEQARMRFAFTMWLQNCLNMPIFLATRSTARFCEHAGCGATKLREAADRLDLSASLVDDVLDLWAATEEASPAPVGAEVR